MKTSIQKAMRLVGTAMFALALLGGVGAVGFMGNAIVQAWQGSSTTGRVIALRDVAPVNAWSAHSARSEVEFVADDGRRYRFTDALARANDARHSVGDQVKVTYRPDAPEQAAIWGSLWWRGIGSAAMALGALVLLGIGVLLRLLARLPWQVS